MFFLRVFIDIGKLMLFFSLYSMDNLTKNMVTKADQDKVLFYYGTTEKQDELACATAIHFNSLSLTFVRF